MKTLFRLLLPLLALCFTACGGDSTDDPDPTPGPPTPPVTEDEIVFADGRLPAPLFPDAGGEQTVRFTASCPWTATVVGETDAAGTSVAACGRGGTKATGVSTSAASGGSRADAAWLTVAPASGASGAATVVVAAQPNDTGDDRTAAVTLEAGTARHTFTVRQMRRDALVAAPDSFTVDNAGGEVSIEVTANLDFDVEIGADWISRLETRALSTETLRFRVAENTSYDNRMATITFTSKDGTLTQEVKIYQAQKDAIVVSPTDYVFDEKYRIFEIEVRANVEFTVENPDVLWLDPIETRALKPHTLEYRLHENATYDSRSAEIRIVDTKRNLAQTVKVTQLQKNALVVAQSSYTLPQEGGEITVELGRNVEFDIEIAQPWIERIETRGLVTEHLRFRVAENPTEQARTGVIAFVSKDHEIRQEVRIEQVTPADEAILREYLVRLYRDTDGDHWTNNTNWCSNRPIYEWYGVEYRDGKPRLDLYGNNLRGAIDLSGCTALTYFNCYGNQLSGLDVSGCTALEWLTCSNNQLSGLNVSGCTALDVLYCDGNQLTDLDVSGCTALSELSCNNYYLTSLNVSGTALRRLSCGGDRLMSLDVSGCTVLEELSCGGNRLSSLDVSGCTALKRLSCDNNRLTVLNVSFCTALEVLSCGDNQLSGLDVSGCTALGWLDCHNNRLTGLDVSGCTALEVLSCYDNPLTGLDISGCTALRRLSCYDNQLTGLDVSGCTALASLTCYNNQLTSLDVSGCTALEELSCYTNRLTGLDVSGCAALRWLSCYDNQLTGLNVSGCMALLELDCRNNQLSGLDVSGRTALLKMSCHDNRLMSLNVSGCTALEELSCGGNQLSGLDVSGCAALTMLRCHDNQLTDITGLSDCVSMRDCDTRKNKICQEIPLWVKSNGLSVYRSVGPKEGFGIDGYRYDYYKVLDETSSEYVTRYRDLGVGWWYPGEPESLHNDW